MQKLLKSEVMIMGYGSGKKGGKGGKGGRGK